MTALMPQKRKCTGIALEEHALSPLSATGRVPGCPTVLAARTSISDH